MSNDFFIVHSYTEQTGYTETMLDTRIAELGDFCRTISARYMTNLTSESRAQFLALRVKDCVVINITEQISKLIKQYTPTINGIASLESIAKKKNLSDGEVDNMYDGIRITLYHIVNDIVREEFLAVDASIDNINAPVG